MRLKGIVITFAVLTVCGLAMRNEYSRRNIEHKRNFVPATLATGSFFRDGDCGDPFSYQGAFLFDLREETLQQLRSQGMHFLQLERVGKGGRPGYFGSEWKQTPVPNDISLYNLDCATNHGSWPVGITEAARASGGFYKGSGSGRTLIVLPNQGYVVGILSDR